MSANSAILDAPSLETTQDEHDRLKPGDMIDAYRVERLIGQGGMGYVLAAHHEQLGQRVAIKCLRAGVLSDPLAAGRFLREARAAVSLKSEHVAQVFGLGTHPSGTPYMVMEFLEGRDLDRVLEDGVLGVDDAVAYVLQTCEAIAEAHAGGLVHRDLKPANLFLTERVDGSPLVKVLDFGIAKVVHEATHEISGLTATGTTLGTPMYMSPEQVRDATDVDARTDIWSLGTVLYQLLTGAPPFQGDTVPSLCAKIVADPPPPLDRVRSDVPIGLARIVERCLQKDKNARFQTVAELALALGPFAPEHSRLYVDRIVGVTTRAQKGSSPPTNASARTTADTEAATPFPRQSDDALTLEASTKLVPTTGPGSVKRQSRGVPIWVALLFGALVLGATLLVVEPWSEDTPQKVPASGPSALEPDRGRPVASASALPPFVIRFRRERGDQHTATTGRAATAGRDAVDGRATLAEFAEVATNTEGTRP